MRATHHRLSELVRVEKPDIIHAHSPVLNVIPAIAVAKSVGLPIVYEVRALWEDAAVDHGTAKAGDLRYRLSRLLDTYAMRRVDCVAAICEPLRQEIVGRRISADKVVVVPNCVDRSFLVDAAGGNTESELRAKFNLKNQVVLGFIGSFYAYEGLDLLIGAAQRLRQRGMNFSILLVGGGPEEDHLKALSSGLGLDDCIHFVGRVHHTEVPRYYRLIDLLVFPRKRMRLTELVTPLKPLEAMAQMKPVLASDVGGHKELIRNGETGCLFRADDVEALATSLAQIIADPSRRSRLAANGRQYVERDRTWDRLCDRYQKIYARLGIA
jgi:PEP-CTERM/exosortase A-associated glycosyltransferase